MILKEINGNDVERNKNCSMSEVVRKCIPHLFIKSSMTAILLQESSTSTVTTKLSGMNELLTHIMIILLLPVLSERVHVRVGQQRAVAGHRAGARRRA